MTEFQGIEGRVRQILQEKDPERRRALSRQLRADIGDQLSDEEREKLKKIGIEFPDLKGGLRDV